MRNGNQWRIQPKCRQNKFLSYLWGMETLSTACIVLFYISVLILPMRNGNILEKLRHPSRDNGSYPTYEEWKLYLQIVPQLEALVLILPMRNGNGSNCLNSSVRLLSSYPTYEEWKHLPKKISYTLSFGSYPTYEEWKLSSKSIALHPLVCSYPTYEEWKHILFLYLIPAVVKFLSYLWGMETTYSTLFVHLQ